MFDQHDLLGRRTLMATGAALAVAGLARSALPSAVKLSDGVDLASAGQNNPPPLMVPATLNPQLLRKALASLRQHVHRISHQDRIAIVDFDAPSSAQRLHFIHLASGESSRLHVAHGSGSDPRHTGFLHHFSNTSGSNASSDGAFVTSDYYVGKHGRSQRLVGLDPTNDNALERAIVIHGAWYAEPDMIAAHGKLGRSQGCFAVGDQCLDQMFDHLGTGRLLYAGRA